MILIANRDYLFKYH